MELPPTRDFLVWPQHTFLTCTKAKPSEPCIHRTTESSQSLACKTQVAVSLGCLVGSMKSVDAGEIVLGTIIPGAQMRKSGNHLNYQLQEFMDF